MNRPDRGMSGSVQWAILVPVILLTVLGAIQVGLWAYGRTVASHAAIAAAEEAALLGASEADARALGTEIASGGGLTAAIDALDAAVTAGEISGERLNTAAHRVQLQLLSSGA